MCISPGLAGPHVEYSIVGNTHCYSTARYILGFVRLPVTYCSAILAGDNPSTLAAKQSLCKNVSVMVCMRMRLRDCSVIGSC